MNSLKILQIIPSLNKGGAERLVLDICNELQNRTDVEVLLVILSKKNDYSFLSKNIKYVICSAKVIPSISDKFIIQIEQLQKTIDGFKPNIIHSHLFESEIVSRSCYYPNVHWFSHCHDNMVQFENFSLKTLFNKRKLTNYFEKRYLFKHYKKNGGNSFIAISNDTKKYFIKNTQPYQSSLLPNAINYPFFYKPKDYKINKQKIKLINVGSLVNKKNQSFLIDVAIYLKKNHVEFELHLLGDGINKGSLKAKIESNKLEKQVFLHGNVNDVEKQLWQSDIYLHSAIYEPFGLALIEAMAAGLPVISLDGKGNRDILLEGKNGYMLFDNNPITFAETIINLSNDKIKYEQISIFAQQYAQRYDIKEYVDKLLLLYNESTDSTKCE